MSYFSDPFYTSHWVVRSDLWDQFIRSRVDIWDWAELSYDLIFYLDSLDLLTCIKHIPFVMAHNLSLVNKPPPEILRNLYLNKCSHQDLSDVISTEYGYQLKWCCNESDLLYNYSDKGPFRAFARMC